MAAVTDFLIDYEGRPEWLDRTLQGLGRAALVGAPDYLKVEDHYVMRVFGDPGFIKFAVEHQGYCKIVKQLPELV